MQRSGGLHRGFPMRELRRTFADLKAYLTAQRRRLACERALGILLVLPFVIADRTHYGNQLRARRRQCAEAGIPTEQAGSARFQRRSDVKRLCSAGCRGVAGSARGEVRQRQLPPRAGARKR